MALVGVQVLRPALDWSAVTILDQHPAPQRIGPPKSYSCVQHLIITPSTYARLTSQGLISAVPHQASGGERPD